MRDINADEFNSFIQLGGATSSLGMSVHPHGSTTETPAVYVTRHCSLLPSSLAAAVRDGVRVLQTYAVQSGPAALAAPVIGVRNKRQATVTLDIYLPLAHASKAPLTGEIRAGSAPGPDALILGGQGPLRQFLLLAGELANAGAWRLDMDFPDRPRPRSLKPTIHPNARPLAKDTRNA